MDTSNQPPKRGSLEDRKMRCDAEVGQAAREASVESDEKTYLKYLADELRRQRHTVAEKWVDKDGHQYHILSYNHGIACYIQVGIFSQGGYDKIESLKKAKNSTKVPDILRFAINLSEQIDTFSDNDQGRIKYFDPFIVQNPNIGFTSDEDSSFSLQSDDTLDEDNPF